MVSLTTPAGERQFRAAPFELLGTDGKRHSLDSVHGENGTVVMFICNHCPYVKAVVTKIVRDMNDLRRIGVGSIAVMSNDVASYPDDSLDNMKVFAAQNHFEFPYVIDETQEVARAYDAVCTPDFFGFDRHLTLAYRGRLDSSGRSSDPGAERELFDAMAQVARTGRAPVEQTPSIGCSIKWR